MGRGILALWRAQDRDGLGPITGLAMLVGCEVLNLYLWLDAALNIKKFEADTEVLRESMRMWDRYQSRPDTSLENSICALDRINDMQKTVDLRDALSPNRWAPYFIGVAGIPICYGVAEFVGLLPTP